MSPRYTRCKCGKRAHRDMIAAKYFLAMAAVSDNDKRKEVRVYRCEYGRIHTTSRPGPTPGAGLS